MGYPANMLTYVLTYSSHPADKLLFILFREGASANPVAYVLKSQYLE
jgi:hypothetical protein